MEQKTYTTSVFKSDNLTEEAYTQMWLRLISVMENSQNVKAKEYE